jgi:hypothetical protein
MTLERIKTLEGRASAAEKEKAQKLAQTWKAK